MEITRQIKKPTRELRMPSKAKVEETLALAELGKKARMVFHDLSNHITALTMSIGDLEESLLRDRERLREYAVRSEMARTQMEYVADLIRNHIKQSTCELFSPAVEIEKVVRGFMLKSGRSGVQVITKTDNTIRVFGSKNDFIHIISNLVSNALDSFETVENTKNKERQVEILLSKECSGYLIQVSDTGCGISKQNLSKVFERGFSTKKHGHGLGLFATKEYVERSFGGTIKVLSSDQGTRFLVVIPNSYQGVEDPKNQKKSHIKQNGNRSPFPVLLSQKASKTF